MMSIRKTLWTLFLVGALLGLITCTSGTDPISDDDGQNVGDPVPFIANITPQAGPAAGGTLVTITGNFLDYVKSATFIDVPAFIISKSNGTLLVVTGSIGNIPANITGDVKLTNGTGGTDEAVNAWTYLAGGVSPDPLVTAVCPPLWPADDPDVFNPSAYGLGPVACDWDGDGSNDMPAGGFPSVRISGENLTFVDATPGSNGVELVDVPVNMVLQQAQTFLYVDPAPFGGLVTTIGDVEVRTAAGQTAVLDDAFSYMVGGVSPDTPDAITVTPNVVSESGGVTVTIRGRSLAGVDLVEFVNINTTADVASISVISNEEIRVVVPAFVGTFTGDSVQGAVTVKAGALVDPTPVTPFTYTRLLTEADCDDIDPDTGTEGTLMTITGEDLGDVLNNPAIALAIPTIDGVPLDTQNVTYLDTNADGRANEVLFQLPRLCAGGTLEIQLVDQFTRLLDACDFDITYTAPFELNEAAGTPTNPNPNTGRAAGGDEIDITGCGLLPVDRVTICGLDATISEKDPDGDEITVITPPSASGGSEVCDVIVYQGTDSLRLRDAFTYNAGLPDGQSMVPNVGPLCGGTQFRLFGFNLTNVDELRFGAIGDPNISTSVQVTVNISDTELLAITPDSFKQFDALTPILFEVAAVDNSVTPPLVDPSPVIFVYGHPQPASMPSCVRPGDTVTVTGTGFQDPTTGRDLVESVVINPGGFVADATVLDETTLTFVVPAGVVTGAYTLQFTVPGDDNDCYRPGGDPSADTLSFRSFTTENDPDCTVDGCINGIDDDGDTFIDCEDTDCDQCTDPGETCDPSTYLCTEIICDDGIDNDSDGDLDCNDTDCDQCTDPGEACEPTTGQCIETDCIDGIDNNGDGRADEADIFCCLQLNPPPADQAMCIEPCANERDDNGDGVADGNSGECIFLGIDGCRDGVDNTIPPDGLWDEGAPDCFGPNACIDGIDNDGNGTADEGDIGCWGGNACNDGIDNDLNGDTDEADANCCLAVSPGDPLCISPCDNERDDNGNGIPDGEEVWCTGGGIPIGCRDNVDNDSDLTIDEGDAGCFTNGCVNVIDDDGDGCADILDSDCGGIELVCNDGVDNDCDGRTDEADSDCGSCENEQDDDGDTLADGNDPDCVPHGEDGCQDGQDNDLDGRIDEADIDCYGVGSCFDTTDNDADGWVDCRDPNCCAAEPACSGTVPECP